MSETQHDMQQYVSFTLGDEIFAVDVAKAREILGYVPVTRVPQTPDFMLGVINLRGSVVPVVDLRLKFGMPVAERTVDTCVIVIEIAIEGDTTVVGILVDAVQEVLDLGADQIEPPPRLGTKLKVEFIKGMGKVNDEFLIILDIDRIFSVDEFALVQQIGDDTETSSAGADVAADQD